MGIVSNTVKLLSKPLEIARDVISPAGSIKKSLKDRYNDFAQELKRQRAGLKDIKKTNYDLGLTHYFKGNYADARMRFNLLKWFKYNPPELNYFIGRCFYEEGKGEKAKKSIADYLASGHAQFREEAEFTLKIIEGKLDEIKAIPNSLIAHFFDLISPIYEQVYVTEAQETPQAILFSELNRLITEKGKPFGNRILDLGCGTGILAKWARKNKIASHITGVDLSPLMLAKAKELKVEDFMAYNELQKADVISYLKGLSKDVKFDIFLASKLFSSEPRIDEILNLTHEHSEEKAIFAFSFKTHEDPANFRFYADVEEFIYNKDYVLSTVKNWNILNKLDVSFVDGDVGMVIILQK